MKVEGEGGGEDTGAGSTNEPFLIMDTDTYGFKFPECVIVIIFPKGITTIGRIGLNYFPNLQSIVIPESVTSIGSYAFEDCSGLKTINYTGTEEQWNAINKGFNWNTKCPSDMTINFNYQE